MPISGLMLTLSGNDQASRSALSAIKRTGCIELGLRDDRRVAVVLDAPTDEVNQHMWRWLNELPGVTRVDVVYVSFEDEHEADGMIDRSPGPEAEEIAQS